VSLREEKLGEVFCLESLVCILQHSIINSGHPAELIESVIICPSAEVAATVVELPDRESRKCFNRKAVENGQVN
jgi:hypothetical protein